MLFKKTEKYHLRCYGLKCAPQTIHVEVLSPSISECDLVWRWGLFRSHWVKMGL